MADQHGSGGPGAECRTTPRTREAGNQPMASQRQCHGFQPEVVCGKTRLECVASAKPSSWHHLGVACDCQTEATDVLMQATGAAAWCSKTGFELRARLARGVPPKLDTATLADCGAEYTHVGEQINNSLCLEVAQGGTIDGDDLGRIGLVHLQGLELGLRELAVVVYAHRHKRDAVAEQVELRNR